MGKGDKRSRRGKIFAGSFGKARPKSKKKNVAPSAAGATEEKPKTKSRKKAAE